VVCVRGCRLQYIASGVIIRVRWLLKMEGPPLASLVFVGEVGRREQFVKERQGLVRDVDGLGPLDISTDEEDSGEEQQAVDRSSHALTTPTPLVVPISKPVEGGPTHAKLSKPAHVRRHDGHVLKTRTTFDTQSTPARPRIIGHAVMNRPTGRPSQNKPKTHT
jgi:hypothetical protein